MVMKGMFFSFTAQSVSGQKLGEREGAMDTWWNHVVLPMGREQDCVNACVIRTRWDIEDRPIGIVTVHRQSHAIEVPNRRLEDNEMQSSRRLFAVMVTAWVRGVVERIVQRSEIAARGDRCTCRVDRAVVGGGRRR